MSEAAVFDNRIVFNNRAYYRTGSESVTVGAVGEKRTPITKPNWLEVKDRILASKLKVRTVGPIGIDTQRTDKREFAASVSPAMLPAGVKVEHAYEALRTAQLSLLYVEVDTDAMLRAINQSEHLREKMKDWGDDMRVCVGGFVIVDAKTTKTFSSSTSVQADITAQGITVTPELTVGSSGGSAVTWPRGMLLGYMLSKLEWNEGNPKKSTRVSDLRIDPLG
jgi:hypothetical protein